MTVPRVLEIQWPVAIVLVLLAISWTAHATTAASVEPRARVWLNETAQVESSTIYLRDIARIETNDDELRRKLEQMEVGRAALPGSSRRLTVGSIVLRARQARLINDIEFTGAEDHIEVHTAAQIVSARRIEQTIEQWYKEQLIIPDDAVLHVEVDSSEVVVGVGEVEITLVTGSVDWGRNLLTIELKVNEELAKRLQLIVTATVEQDVYVARRHFARQEVIHEADVQQQRMRLDRPATLFEPATVRTTRSVRAGTPLTWAVVERIPEVVQGERVQVEAERGTVYIEIVGVAESDGRLGEEIVVRNEKTGVTFNAVVVAPQRVRVVY